MIDLRHCINSLKRLIHITYECGSRSCNNDEFYEFMMEYAQINYRPKAQSPFSIELDNCIIDFSDQHHPFTARPGFTDVSGSIYLDICDKRDLIDKSFYEYIVNSYVDDCTTINGQYTAYNNVNQFIIQSKCDKIVSIHRYNLIVEYGLFGLIVNDNISNILVELSPHIEKFYFELFPKDD